MVRNVSIELWLGIGVKHMAFLELWLRMTSLELWLRMTDEHKEHLSCDSSWRVFCGMSVRVVARIDGST